MIDTEPDAIKLLHAYNRSCRFLQNEYNLEDPAVHVDGVGLPCMYLPGTGLVEAASSGGAPAEAVCSGDSDDDGVEEDEWRMWRKNKQGKHEEEGLKHLGFRTDIAVLHKGDFGFVQNCEDIFGSGAQSYRDDVFGANGKVVQRASGVAPADLALAVQEFEQSLQHRDKEAKKYSKKLTKLQEECAQLQVFSLNASINRLSLKCC